MKTESPTKKLNIAVIGLGKFAHVCHLPSLTVLRERVNLTACCAKTEKSATAAWKAYGFDSWYTDLDRLLSENHIDAAFVVTPKDTHYEIVKTLLNQGIHVFCEKPLATRISHVEELVVLAEKKQRTLMVGFNRRFVPVYHAAREVFRDTQIDVCTAFKNRPGTEYRATLENTIHMVDLIRFFCGEPEAITGLSQFEDPYHEHTAAAMVQFKEGSIGMILGNRTCGQWMERVELYGGGLTVIVNAPDEYTVVDHEQERHVKLTPLHMGWASLQEKMGFLQETEHFISVVEQGVEPLTSGKEALKSHYFMNDILRACGLPVMEE